MPERRESQAQQAFPRGSQNAGQARESIAHGFGYCARAGTIAIPVSPEVRRVDFRFTEEQLLIQDVARRIAQEKIGPSAEHFDKSGEFPLDNIRLLGENGLMGIEVPA